MFMFMQVELVLKFCHYAQEGFIALQLTVTTSVVKVKSHKLQVICFTLLLI